MKEIYSFTVNKKVQTEKVEEENGVKTITQVESTEPVKIIIKKPSRQEAETADFELAREYSRCVRNELLTNALVESLYNKDGFFKEQQSKIVNISDKLVQIQNEYQLLKAEDSESNNDRIIELGNEWTNLNEELQGIRSSFDAIFSNTAETRAKQKVLVWLSLFLTYQEDKNGNTVNVFKGDNYDAKIKHYDTLMDLEDSFYSEVASKAGYLIALWYDRKAARKEDFDDALSLLDSVKTSTNENETTEVEEVATSEAA